MFGVGAAFVALGSLVKRLDNDFAQFNGRLLTTTGIILGALSFGVGAIFSSIGSLGNRVGTSLVQSFQKLSEEFVRSDRQLLIFSKTIDNFNRITAGSSGSTERWSDTIDNLSNTLNFSRIELQRAATEIVAVTSQLGLNRAEMEKVLDISAQYAKVNGKELFPTTVAFASALNGASQGVVQYGVKLNESALQQFLYKQGIDRSVQSLSEQQKAQFRLNSLIAQSAGISGVAIAVSSSLSDQQNRFATQVERANQALGRGAGIIENNNILYGLASSILSTLNDRLVSVAGFVGAFGARVLQITGFLIKWAFPIFAVIKGLTILNIILASSAVQSAFGRSIPFLSQSFNDLTRSITRSNIVINSSRTAFIALGLAVKNQFLPIITELLFGMQPGAVKLTGIFSLLGRTVGRAFGGIAVAGKALLALFTPFVLKLMIVVGIFAALRKAFIEIEERTGAFTSILKALSNELTRGAGIFEPMIRSLNVIKDLMLDLSSRVFGFFVFALAKTVSTLLMIVSPLQRVAGIFSKDFASSIADTRSRLDALSDNLLLTGFDFRALGESSLASTEEINKAIQTVNLQELFRLREELEDTGRSDLQKLRFQLNQRLSLLTQARAEELLTEQTFQNLKSIALEDFAKRADEIRKKEIEDNLVSNQLLADNTIDTFKRIGVAIQEQAERMRITLGQIANAALNGFGNAISGAFAQFGSALAKGENGLKAFANSFIQSIGQIAIQTGSLFILQGIGMLVNPLNFDKAGALALIKQGAALSVFGGFLSAMGGGGISIGAGVGSPGLMGPQLPTSPPDQMEETRPVNQISINVQGDVLDSDDTGLRIVELIKDFTDRNGTSEVFA
jgi:hypothetical protein